MPEFNVLTEDWIPVSDDSGVVREVGLIETLDEAHKLREIVDPSPLVQFGLYRLLIAFVTDALQVGELDEVADILADGRFSNSTIRDYVAHCGNCFDLFDAERPFLQSAGSPCEKTREKCIAELAHHLPSGTFATHFHHGLSADHGFSPAVCARLLTTIAPFMTSGGAGLSPSINGMPPWYVLIDGGNLFRTLALNICGIENRGMERPGVPSWRSDTPVVPKKECHKFSLLEGLTWRPRFVRLLPGEAGRCTYSGRNEPLLVRSMIFEPGLRAMNEAGVWRDPQAAYCMTDKGESPLRPREGRQLWRETGPLTLLQDGEYGREEEKVRFDRPRVVDQYFQLREKDENLISDEHIRLQCFGMRTDGKMKIFQWQTEELQIPARVLENQNADILVQKAMDRASWAENALGKAIKSAYPRDGKSNAKAFQNLVIETRHAFWDSLKQCFNDCYLSRVADNQPDGELDAYWLKTLKDVGLKTLDDVLDGLDTDAAAITRQVMARDYYWRQWNKLLSKDNHKADETAAAIPEEVTS